MANVPGVSRRGGRLGGDMAPPRGARRRAPCNTGCSSTAECWSHIPAAGVRLPPARRLQHLQPGTVVQQENAGSADQRRGCDSLRFHRALRRPERPDDIRRSSPGAAMAAPRPRPRARSCARDHRGRLAPDTSGDVGSLSMSTRRVRFPSGPLHDTFGLVFPKAGCCPRTAAMGVRVPPSPPRVRGRAARPAAATRITPVQLRADAPTGSVTWR